MRLHEILVERVLNLRTPEEKEKYANQVWDVLQASYAEIGGFGTAATIDELIKKFSLWKVVVRNGDVTAVKVYRDQFGRKSVGVGTNGTYQGKKDIKMMMQDDVKTGRMWVEVSGKPEQLYRKFGAMPIDAKYAEILTKHPIMSISPDGYHYTRMIAGKPHEKIIYGVVNLSPEAVEYLKNQGINPHELPPGVKLPQK
jgi:hypothetical protein